MTTEFISKEVNTVTLKMNFTPEEFKTGMEKAYKRKANKFSVPGYRPGKAPMALAMRYYGEAVLYDEAIDALFAEAYGSAIEEHKLNPVDRPGIDINAIGGDKGLELTLEVTVFPEVQLGKYLGVEAIKLPLSDVEKDLEHEIERLQEKNSRLITIEDRAVENGDIVNIDYEGFKDGEAFAGGTAQGHELTIGSGTFIPGFEEQLIGKNIAEDCELNLSFPEDYHAEELKGQAVVFKVRVNSIQHKELPELDDEFAKDVSEFDTLAEYKDSLRKDLEKKAQQRVDTAFMNEAAQVAIDNATVEIPEVMIEQELDNQVQRQAEQMQGYGIPFETYLSYMGKSKEEFRDTLRARAEEQVKASLVLEAIASKENLDLSEAEYEAAFVKLAEEWKMPVEELKKMDMTSLRNFVAGQSKIEKVLELIKDQAIAIDPPADTDENTDN